MNMFPRLLLIVFTISAFCLSAQEEESQKPEEQTPESSERTSGVIHRRWPLSDSHPEDVVDFLHPKEGSSNETFQSDG